eukprot:6806222-Prymnesium_polylepis.1
MKAEHPAERLLRARAAARGIAACSGSVSAPGGRRLNAALKADHPTRGRASGRAELKHDVAPGRRV